jgi:hypothetical protein
MQIKQALTGYGRADKQQMQRVVTEALKLESIPRPDDAADALAIALCHASVSRFGGLFAVGNTTRTKGKNAVTGSAFQKLMEESGKKTPKKRTATPAPKQQAAVKPQPPRANTAQEIAAALVKSMKESTKKDGETE